MRVDGQGAGAGRLHFGSKLVGYSFNSGGCNSPSPREGPPPAPGMERPSIRGIIIRLLVVCPVALATVWPSSCANGTFVKQDDGHYSGTVPTEASCTCTATSFHVPSHETVIPSSAFAWCSSLTNITGMAESAVTSLGPYAFYASGITSLEWPPLATTIPYRAFWERNSMTIARITGLDGVTEVEIQAFRAAYQLPKVYLPPGCIVGWDAFKNTGGGYQVGVHTYYGTHAPPAPPSPPPPQAPTTFYIRGSRSQIVFGTNDECTLELASGATSLASSCPINTPSSRRLEDASNNSNQIAQMEAKIVELKIDQAEMSRQLQFLTAEFKMLKEQRNAP